VRTPLLDVLLEFTLYVSGEVTIAARDGVVSQAISAKEVNGE
jgi:hypothetical protein